MWTPLLPIAAADMLEDGEPGQELRQRVEDAVQLVEEEAQQDVEEEEVAVVEVDVADDQTRINPSNVLFFQ